MRLPAVLTRLCVATVALLAASPAMAGVVALQDDQLPNFFGNPLEARLDALAETKTRVTRVDILWDQVAPTRPARPLDPADPAYRWDRYDAIVRGLAARQIVPILTYYRTPTWGSASRRPEAAPHPVDAGRFAGAIARRYSGTFRDAEGRLLPKVRRIEIWNEPNIDQFWTPQCRRGPKFRYVPVAARRYAALASVAAREIRAAQPDAIVIGGVAGPAGGLDDGTAKRPKLCLTGTESAAATTMIRFLKAENVRLDAWSQHLYPIGSPTTAFNFPSWRSLPQLFTMLDKLQPGLPVYVTETGYHTSYNRFHRYFVSEQQQADWLDETFAMANRYPRVAVTVWFNLQDNPHWTGGLLRDDKSPKPARERYVTLAGNNPPPPEWRQ